MMNVWYKVDGLEADLVEGIQDGAVIAQFRTAVKSHLGQELQEIYARDLEVYCTFLPVPIACIRVSLFLVRLRSSHLSSSRRH